MLYGHAIDALLAPQYRSGWWHEAWLFQRGLTSCLFLLLSGFAFSIATTRHWTAQITWSPAIVRRARRFSLFVLLGYALHTPVSTVRDLMTASDETWRALLAVDILQLIGMTFIGVQLLVMTLRSRAAVTVAALGIAVATAVLTPAVWGVRWTDHAPLIVAAYLFPDTGSQFPLLPWAAFILLGVALGQIYSRWDPARLPAYATRVLLVPGLAMVAVWLALNAAGAAMVGSGPANFVPSLVLIRAGACLLILAAVTQVSRRVTRLPHVVNAMAQETLTIYFVHICIVYGSIWNPGLRYAFGMTLSPLPLVAIIVGLIAAMAMLAASWNRWKHMHPRRVRTVVIATGVLMLLRLL